MKLRRRIFGLRKETIEPVWDQTAAENIQTKKEGITIERAWDEIAAESIQAKKVTVECVWGETAC